MSNAERIAELEEELSELRADDEEEVEATPTTDVAALLKRADEALARGDHNASLTWKTRAQQAMLAGDSNVVEVSEKVAEPVDYATAIPAAEAADEWALARRLKAEYAQKVAKERGIH